MLEGIKVVETVVKRMEDIEKTQVEHGERLQEQEAITKKHKEKIEETVERTTAMEKKLDDIDSKKIGSMEERMRKIESSALDVKLTNAVVKEIRQMEKNEKNFMVWNVAESPSDEAESRKKHDESAIYDILKEIDIENIEISNVIRVGNKGGRYPRKIKVALRTSKDCQRVMSNAEDLAKPLKNDVIISHDRTFNQREEARLFRVEKEKEENEGTASQGGAGGGGGRGRGRGRGKGPGRPKGSGLGPSRGRGDRQGRSNSRKRRISDDQEGEEADKRQRTVNAASTASSTTVPIGSASAAAAAGTPVPVDSASSSSSSPTLHATASAEKSPQPQLQQVAGRLCTPISAANRKMAVASDAQKDF